MSVEEADSQCSPKTLDSKNHEGLLRVVNFESEQQLAEQTIKNSSNQADDECVPDFNSVARGRDRNRPREHCIGDVEASKVISMDYSVKPRASGNEGQACCWHRHDCNHDHFLRRINLDLVPLFSQNLVLLWRQAEVTRVVAREVLRVDELNRDKHNESTWNVVGRIRDLVGRAKVILVEMQD